MKSIFKKMLLSSPRLLKRSIIGISTFNSAITVRAVSSEEDLKMVFQIRWKVYSEAGYINEATYPEKMMSDRYDKFSTNFLVKKKGGAIGSARLVKDSILGFPIEAYFNIDLSFLDRKRTMELSRLVILKNERGGWRSASLKLTKFIYNFSIENKINTWLAFMPERLRDSFAVLGAEFSPLANKGLNREHVLARKDIQGYFDKNNPEPYFIHLNSFNP